jgi:hypothetical protein
VPWSWTPYRKATLGTTISQNWEIVVRGRREGPCGRDVVGGARTYYYRKYRGPSWDVVPYELAGSADTAVRGRPCGPVSLEAPRLT